MKKRIPIILLLGICAFCFYRCKQRTFVELTPEELDNDYSYEI